MPFAALRAKRRVRVRRAMGERGLMELIHGLRLGGIPISLMKQIDDGV